MVTGRLTGKCYVSECHILHLVKTYNRDSYLLNGFLVNDFNNFSDLVTENDSKVGCKFCVN